MKIVFLRVLPTRGTHLLIFWGWGCLHTWGVFRFRIVFNLYVVHMFEVLFPFGIVLFLVGEPELNIWLCVVSVWCPCGVPWMDAMLWSVNKTTVQSQSVCTVYVYTQHNRGQHIVLNRAGFLAWASALHGSPTLAGIFSFLYRFQMKYMTTGQYSIEQMQH